VKAIYDNEAKRSFEHADVNTIIALFDSPLSRGVRGVSRGIWPALQETTRFVMFKKPFEEAINTKNLLAIEKADIIQKTEAYRVYPVKQEALLEEGWEQPGEEEEETETSDRGDKALAAIIGTKPSPSSKATPQSPPLSKGGSKGGYLLKEKFITGKYEGNKWGGKYLRAPDIFFTILEKGKGKLVRLGDIAEVRRGFTTGCNEFFYLTPLNSPLIKGGHRGVLKVCNSAGWEGEIEDEFLKPVIKSPRECKSIQIKQEDLKYKVFMCHKDKKELKGTNALKYIEWGEEQGFHKRPTCIARQRWWELGEPPLSNFLWTMTYRERFFVVKNNLVYADARFYDMYSSEEVGALVNSTFSLFWLELQARGYGGGGGPVDVKVYEVLNLNIPLASESYKADILSAFSKIYSREIKSVFEELGINPALPVREQKPNPLPDRKALDDIVFDILGLTEDERNEVYWAVCELVANRLNKARSL
jgi:hypothetical protein